MACPGWRTSYRRHAEIWLADPELSLYCRREKSDLPAGPAGIGFQPVGDETLLHLALPRYVITADQIRSRTGAHGLP